MRGTHSEALISSYVQAAVRDQRENCGCATKLYRVAHGVLIPWLLWVVGNQARLPVTFDYIFDQA